MDLYKSCSTLTIKLIDYIQKNPDTIHHMDQFLSRYQNAIFNFIRLTTGNYHDSLELTNRVLLTLSKKVKEIRAKKAFNYMALKVIKGEISNYWRGQKTLKAKMMKQATIWHNDEQISLLDTLESNESTAEEILNLLAIRDMIEHDSDPNMQQVFVRRYRDDESIIEISQNLKITEYQVKKYIREIQKLVEKHMAENCGD